LRKELATLEDDVGTARDRFTDVVLRAEEIRDSLRALDKVPGADDLRRKLVASLRETTLASDTLVKTMRARRPRSRPSAAGSRTRSASSHSTSRTLSFPGILAGACEMAPAGRRCAHLPDHPGARAQTTRPSPLHPAAP
jgi:hypothetical protein